MARAKRNRHAEDSSGSAPVRAAPLAPPARLAAVIEAAAEGIITIDPQGRFASVNAAAERILGVSRHELIGLPSAAPPYRRFTLDGEPLGEDPLPTDVQAADGRVFHHEYLIERTDGSRVAIARDLTVLSDEHGAPAGVVSTFSDVSARLHAEAALRESEASAWGFGVANMETRQPVTAETLFRARPASALRRR